MNYGEMADIEIVADEIEEMAQIRQELAVSYKLVKRSIRAWIGIAAVLLVTMAIPAYGAKQTPSRASRNLDTIARVLYIEARGESEAGMRGTASVMYYRGKGKASTIAAEVSSVHWNGRYGQRLLRNVKPSGSAWTRAKKIAGEIVAGKFQPPFKANLVHSTAIAKPNWSGAGHVATVGNQVFYYAKRVI